MAYLGTVKLGDNLVFYAQTSAPSTGAETDADAVPSYRVYEDEADPPLLTGNMAKLDDDDTTGFYSKTIAVTSGNGFEVGKTYCIRKRAAISTVYGADLDTFTVDSKRVSDLADLTAQDVRNALKLAPAAGAPADGSVDKHLDDAALEATLTAIQGAGWTIETLMAIYALVGTRAAPGDAMSFAMTATQVTTALSAQTLNIHRGDVLSVSITPTVARNISARTKAWFVIKDSKDDADAASYLFIEETDGLTIFSGAAYPTPTDGSITVTDATIGEFTLMLSAAVTSLLTEGTRFWEFQVLETDGPHTVATGDCTVTLDVVRAIS